MRSFTAKNLKAFVSPLLLWSTNELAHLDHCLPLHSHACMMWCKQDPDVEYQRRKCKVMLISDLWWRSRLCNNQTPPPLTRGSRKTQQQVCCFYCMSLKCKQEEAHYQSTTGTISSSGWFPTTWSMKSSFPFGLEERMKKKTNSTTTGPMMLLYNKLYSNLCKPTICLIRGPWTEGVGSPAETIRRNLSSPQTCVWCHHTAENKQVSII